MQISIVDDCSTAAKRLRARTCLSDEPTYRMGVIEDSIRGIFRALQEGALTMQQGGGIGADFSTLRPRGTPAKAAGNIASGAVSFMHIWDAMCGTIFSTGARRGAMVATPRCDHPDIEEFVIAKQQSGHCYVRHLPCMVRPWSILRPAIAWSRRCVGPA
ncbi:MAG: hypothetical protein WB677_23250 [Xanthobacteraceae bacterium]